MEVESLDGGGAPRFAPLHADLFFNHQSVAIVFLISKSLIGQLDAINESYVSFISEMIYS